MKAALQFLAEHGHAVLFAVVLVDQIGLPLPALPFLFATGALVRAGQLSAVLALFLAVVASLAGHWIWYEAGRRRGATVLALICRISIEPDACVRQTEDLFDRYGSKSLLFADFLPGLGTVAQPLAGMSGMSLRRFLLLDTLGALLWAGSGLLVGWVFRDQLELLAELAEVWGGRVLMLVAACLVLYFAVKIFRRHRLLGEKAIRRMRAEELKRMFDRGEQVAVVDLRHRRERERDPWIIPGSHLMTLDAIDARVADLPADADIVLYCT